MPFDVQGVDKKWKEYWKTRKQGNELKEMLLFEGEKEIGGRGVERGRITWNLVTKWERTTWQINGELEKKKWSYKVKILKVLFANLDYYHVHSLYPII